MSRNIIILIGFAFASTTLWFFLQSVMPLAPSLQKLAVAPLPVMSPFSLTSPAFIDGGMIPELYTCDTGTPHAPPLTIKNAPVGTGSVVLVMDDPDIPEAVKKKFNMLKFDHWVLYNIPGDANNIEEGQVIGVFGVNSSGEKAYYPPCPPKDMAPPVHRYHFRVYALPQGIDFKSAPTLDQLEKVAKEQALGSAELTGRYQRK